MQRLYKKKSYRFTKQTNPLNKPNGMNRTICDGDIAETVAYRTVDIAERGTVETWQYQTF